MEFMCPEYEYLKYPIKAFFFLCWYSKKTEYREGEEKLNLSIIEILNLLQWDPTQEQLLNCFYPINTAHLIEKVASLIKHKINLKKYDYFIEYEY